MGCVSLFGTLSLLFAGPHRCLLRSGRYTYMPVSLEESPNGNQQQKQPLSVWNRTVAKYGLEKAREIRRKGGQKRAQEVNEKYGSIYNATLTKYGPEKANEVYRQNLRKANEALMEKYTYEERQQIGLAAGVKSARKRGEYCRYPGVCCRQELGKWQVQFTHKGKRYYGGLHETEEEAALAHDEFVRLREMNRPLHFPREGERTSYVD